MAVTNGTVGRSRAKWNILPSNSSLALNFKEEAGVTFSDNDIVMCLGDPTVYGALTPPENATRAIKEAVEGLRCNGYNDAVGHIDARAAVIRYEQRTNHLISPEDVVITHGCDGALTLAMSVLANPGQNILIPEIAYRLYGLHGKYLGCEVRQYALLPERSWEIDLDHLESLVDDQTACVIITNPHNPTGAVYSEQHLRDLLHLANRRKLIIVADEVYAHMVFPPYKFTQIAELSDTVPTLSTNSISKRFYLPGWRVGWLIIHDRNEALRQVRDGIERVVSIDSGVCSLVQRSLDSIINQTPQSFFEEGLSFFYENAELAVGMLSRVPGLKARMPHGGFYLLVALEMRKFPAFRQDVGFMDAMSKEVAVHCFPSSALGHGGYFRIVLTIPRPRLAEACQRIAQFAARHYVP